MIRRKSLWFTAVVMSAVSTVGAQQRPTFETGKGPVVLIDEAHQNTHTISTPSFRGLVQLLEADGYTVKPLAVRITREALAGISVLVLCAPGGWNGGDAELDQREIAVLLEWVHTGGALLLILDHMPAPKHAAGLTRALGVPDWHDGYVNVRITDTLMVSNINFRRPDAMSPSQPSVGPTGPGGGRGYQGSDAMLANHPVTDGRSPAERVQWVATFGGSAFRLPPGAEPILTLPQRSESLVPPPTPGAIPVFTGDTPRTAVGGWYQGAVLGHGRGRVALFGEAGLFSGGPAAENRRFILNIAHWLTDSR